MVVLSFGERMQSDQARLSQTPSAVAVFDAIQQNGREVACPDCPVRCGMSLAHEWTPEVRHQGPHHWRRARRWKKVPYISKAVRNADFAAQPNITYARLANNGRNITKQIA